MITMKDIVREGHPALRKVADEVSLPPSSDVKEILDKMLTFLKNSQDDDLAKKYKLRSGVGLAAPQININKRLIAIYFQEPEGDLHSYQLINPKIVSHSVQQSYLAQGEGCLSVDREVEGYIVRHARVTVKAYTPEGEAITLRLKGFPAIIIQHEIDHLNGIMFYDHINEQNPFHIPEGAKAIE